MVEQNWLSPQVKRSVIISKLLVAKHNNNNNDDDDDDDDELKEALQTHLL